MSHHGHVLAGRRTPQARGTFVQGAIITTAMEPHQT